MAKKITGFTGEDIIAQRKKVSSVGMTGEDILRSRGADIPEPIQYDVGNVRYDFTQDPTEVLRRQLGLPQTTKPTQTPTATPSPTKVITPMPTPTQQITPTPRSTATPTPVPTPTTTPRVTPTQIPVQQREIESSLMSPETMNKQLSPLTKAKRTVSGFMDKAGDTLKTFATGAASKLGGDALTNFTTRLLYWDWSKDFEKTPETMRPATVLTNDEKKFIEDYTSDLQGKEREKAIKDLTKQYKAYKQQDFYNSILKDYTEEQNQAETKAFTFGQTAGSFGRMAALTGVTGNLVAGGFLSGAIDSYGNGGSFEDMLKLGMQEAAFNAAGGVASKYTGKYMGELLKKTPLKNTVLGKAIQGFAGGAAFGTAGTATQFIFGDENPTNEDFARSALIGGLFEAIPATVRAAMNAKGNKFIVGQGLEMYEEQMKREYTKVKQSSPEEALSRLKGMIEYNLATKEMLNKADVPGASKEIRNALKGMDMIDDFLRKEAQGIEAWIKSAEFGNARISVAPKGLPEGTAPQVNPVAPIIPEAPAVQKPSNQKANVPENVMQPNKMLPRPSIDQQLVNRLGMPSNAVPQQPRLNPELVNRMVQLQDKLISGNKLNDAEIKEFLDIRNKLFSENPEAYENSLSSIQDANTGLDKIKQYQKGDFIQQGTQPTRPTAAPKKIEQPQGKTTEKPQTQGIKLGRTGKATIGKWAINERFMIDLNNSADPETQAFKEFFQRYYEAGYTGKRLIDVDTINILKNYHFPPFLETEAYNAGKKDAEVALKRGEKMSGPIQSDITTQETPVSNTPHDLMANKLLDYIRKGQSFTADKLFEIAEKAYGGSLAEGKFDEKMAYDAMELAVNKYLTELPMPKMEYVPELVQSNIKYLESIINKLPTQTKRSEEMEKFQQFSTPPHLALVANWVANTNPSDVVLEPSAGVGGLAIFAKRNGAEVVVNELSKRRLELLKSMNFDRYFNEDAEQIDNILPEDIKPTVVLMNPPFSSAAARGTKNTTKNAERHIEQALNRLEEGGRLVAIVGRGMADNAPTFKNWWNKIKSKYNVRANISITGGTFKKYGTTFDVQLVVIDKTGPTTDKVLTGEYKSLMEVPKALEGIRNERQYIQAEQPATVAGSKEVVKESGQQQSVSKPSDTGSNKSGGISDNGGRGSISVSDRKSAVQDTGKGIQDVDTTVRGTGDIKQGAESSKQGREVVAADTSGGSKSQSEFVWKNVSNEESGDRSGVRFEQELYQGRGASSKDIYNFVEYPILGEGQYYAFTEEMAKHYGEVSKHKVVLDNPLVIRDDVDWRNLTQKAGWEYPNPYGGDENQAIQNIKNLKEMILKDGHDGVIIQFENDIKGDFNSVTDNPIKVLDNVFAHDQVVSYKSDIKTQGITPKEPSKKQEVAPKEKTEIKIEKANKVTVENESDVYAVYQPKKLKVKSAKPHVTDLVESAAMSAIDPPDVSYTPNLPKEIIENGILSLPQIETVTYAGQSHNTVMENGKRRGFFLGDGTGVGKGRQISGIILDNWRQGRKKAVWVSVNPDLYVDAIRDWKALGGKKDDVIDARKVKIENKIPNKEGILFLGYDTLKVGNKAGKAIRGGAEFPRVDQIVEWFGKDFDGVIVFDEAHKMGNAIEYGKGLNKKKPTSRALSGMELQNALPNARVVYASATGATEVQNLAYADRLGLWGEGTAFRNVNDFISSISSGGLAAMELVARDMKAMGAYLARSISFKGVEYDTLEHDLTPMQNEIYDTLARAWQKILENINSALEITRQSKSGKTYGSAKSAFYGSMQRFFNQILTSMSMPSVLKDIENELAAGNSVVIQLVNTNEAAMNRQLSKAADDDIDLEELDLTPSDTIVEYLQKSFPVQQYEEYVDENGSTKTRPVVDKDGNPVISREAVRMRDSLIAEIKQMKVPDGPLEMIYDTFGVENVAEITGRTRRVVSKLDPKTGERKRIVENWNKAKGLADVDKFQNGDKRILVFSDAGGTGKSYHADRNAKNQSKRIHYLLQPGWNAPNATQGIGRTHRSNQTVAPKVKLVTTNVRGQKRFISTIARRLDQLGALTKGQRQAGSGVFGEKDNLENSLAIDTLQAFYKEVWAERVPDINGKDILKKMGLLDKLTDKENGTYVDNQEVTRKMPIFLNRILSLEVEEQNKFFDAFNNYYLDNFNKAMEAGILDVGLENYPAEKIVLNDEKVIRTDKSGAETKYINLTAYKKPTIWEFDSVVNLRSNFQGLVKINDTGEVKAVFRVGNKTNKDGEIVYKYRLTGPMAGKESEYVQSTLDEKTTKIKEKDWRKVWNQEIAKQPQYQEETLHLLTGSLLPIWNKLGDGKVRIVRILDDKGNQWLGRLVSDEDIYRTLHVLGVGVQRPTYTPEQLQDFVLNQNKVIRLENDKVKISRRKVSGEYRIEITGNNIWFYRKYGLQYLRVNFNDRYFIPSGQLGNEVLARILKDNPVVSAKNNTEPDDGEETLTSTRMGPRLGRATGANATGESKRASEIFKVFANKLDATIKRSPSRGTLGTFNNQTHIIRIRKANDLATLSHEVGHMFDRMHRFNEIKDKQIRQELESLGAATSMPSYSPARVRREGVAEFVRLYLTDENQAISQAPNFLNTFEKTLKKDIVDILKELRKDIWDLVNLDPVSRVKRSIHFKGDKEAKQPFDAMGKLRKAYTGLIDAQYPVEWAAGELAGKAAKTHIHNKLAAIRGYEGIALFNINSKGEEGFYQTSLRGRKVGKSYYDITKEIHVDEETRRDFWAYAVSRRARDYFYRGLEMPDTLDTYEETIRTLEQKYPEFPRVFDDLQTYRHNNAMLLVESGIYSKEKLDDIESANPNYVPLKRIMEAFDHVAGSSNRLGGSKRVIKRLRGGGEDIEDPEISDINNTFIYRSVAMRNALLRELADMADSVEGKGGIMARTPIKLKAIQFNLEHVRKTLTDMGVQVDGIDLDVMSRIFQPNYLAGPNQLIVYRNGEPILYDVHPELYDAVKGLNYESMSKFAEIMMSVAQIQKAGIIFTPKYVTYNFARDTFHNLIASDVNITPLDILKGFIDVSTGGKAYRFAMKHGGTTNFFSSNDRKFAKEAIDDIMANQSAAKKFLYKIKHPFRTIQDFIEPTELAGRVAEMKKYLKTVGYSERDIEQAIANMRGLSVDFRRTGLWIKKMHANRWVNFLNTNIQGMDKFVRLWKDNWFRTLTKGFLYMTMPTLFLMWLCSDNEYYNKELPRWRKDFFWNVPLGDPSTTKVFLPIPRPWEMGIVFCAIPERFIEQHRRKNPTAWDEFAETLKQAFVPEFMPSAIDPLFQDATGKDWRGVPILSESDKRLSPEHPELQYNDYTNEIAKSVANSLKNLPVPEALKSPKRLEKIIEGYTGTLGSIAMDSYDQAIGKKEGVPVLGGLFSNFIVDADRSPTSVNDFYRYKAILDSKFQGTKKTGEETDPILKGIRDSYLNAADAISKLQNAINIIDNTDDPDKEIRKAAIKAEIIEIAKSMTKMYEDVYR